MEWGFKFSGSSADTTQKRYGSLLKKYSDILAACQKIPELNLVQAFSGRLLEFSGRLPEFSSRLPELFGSPSEPIPLN